MIAPSHRFVSDPSNQEANSGNSKAVRLAALVDLDEQSAGIKKPDTVQVFSKGTDYSKDRRTEIFE